MLKDEQDKIDSLPPDPGIPPISPIKALAYGPFAVASIGPNTFRTERGVPFLRAGQPVAARSQFRTLNLNAPVSQLALTNGLLDPSQPGFIQRGSIVPTAVTIPFSLSATTTSITITWPMWPIKRMAVAPPTNQPFVSGAFNQSTTIPAGSIAVTSLVAGTTYFFYGFWSEPAQAVGWVIGGTGSPAIAQTAQSDSLLQTQLAQNHVSFNILRYATPASGTTSATGGYSSGNPDITGGGRTYKVY